MLLGKVDDGARMPKLIHLQHGGELPHSATGFLITCIPGRQPPEPKIVSGGWKRAYTVGRDGWDDMWRAHLVEKASQEGVEAIYVVGCQDA